MNGSIQAGEIVRLKSGGPDMTAGHTEKGMDGQPYTPTRRRCYWFDDSLSLYEIFYDATLESVKQCSAA
jgi:uncharacterized protein YodC (DUF2158 family)